jgi:hypothetical protein
MSTILSIDFYILRQRERTEEEKKTPFFLPSQQGLFMSQNSFTLLTSYAVILAQELYGQSSGRIRTSLINSDSLKTQNDFSKRYPSSHTHDRSPTFMQSRRYHYDKKERRNRQFGRPLSYQPQFLSSSYYTNGGTGIEPAPSNQEGCRLTNNFCSGDYQCCSGKCRCVRWSVMGKMSCWKKCF